MVVTRTTFLLSCLFASLLSFCQQTIPSEPDSLNDRSEKKRLGGNRAYLFKSDFFQEGPTIVTDGAQYFLRWKYSEDAHYYMLPKYKIQDDFLVVFISYVYRPNDAGGEVHFKEISSQDEINKIRENKVLWQEPDGGLSILPINSLNESEALLALGPPVKLNANSFFSFTYLSPSLDSPVFRGLYFGIEQLYYYTKDSVNYGGPMLQVNFPLKSSPKDVYLFIGGFFQRSISKHRLLLFSGYQYSSLVGHELKFGTGYGLRLSQSGHELLSTVSCTSKQNWHFTLGYNGVALALMRRFGFKPPK